MLPAMKLYMPCWRWLRAAPAGFLILAAAGTAAPAALAEAGDANSVAMQGNLFLPTPQSVTSGVTVTWTNMDGEDHDVESIDGTLTSPLIPAGTSWSYTFTSPGEYHYFCDLHDNMEGVVVVS